MSANQPRNTNARQRIVLCMDGTWNDIDSKFLLTKMMNFMIKECGSFNLFLLLK
jgi:uncharacterized protein (DUF2235 family)